MTKLELLLTISLIGCLIMFVLAYFGYDGWLQAIVGGA